MKTRVAVLFGGRSVEHDVSIISGIQAYCALNRDKYEAIPLYLTTDNAFYTGAGIDDIASYRDRKALLRRATRVLPVPGENGVTLLRYPPKRFGDNVVGGFDVVLPVVHGTNVEDGTLMGYLEMLGVPYAGCDVTASALGMDKFHMKAVLKEAGLPVLDAKLFTGKEYALNSDAVLNTVEAAMPYPVIVKPVNLGSSVGIAKADDREALRAALDDACGYAARVLVEPAVGHLREINCAVLGDRDECIASVCEEPINSDAILSFKDKYLNPDGAKKQGAKSGGMSSLKRRCPAELPDGMTERVQELACAAFRALDCAGVARIDFLNDRESGALYVNEANTIPGSLSFYLWEAAGLPFDRLLDRLIELAFKRHREREALHFDFQSSILEGVALGGAKGKA